jgi:hypothetical protein
LPNLPHGYEATDDKTLWRCTRCGAPVWPRGVEEHDRHHGHGSMAGAEPSSKKAAVRDAARPAATRPVRREGRGARQPRGPAKSPPFTSEEAAFLDEWQANTKEWSQLPYGQRTPEEAQRLRAQRRRAAERVEGRLGPRHFALNLFFSYVASRTSAGALDLPGLDQALWIRPTHAQVEAFKGAGPRAPRSRRGTHRRRARRRRHVADRAAYPPVVLGEVAQGSQGPHPLSRRRQE